MEYIQALVERKIGWTVKALKVVYCNNERHRAYYHTRGDDTVYLIESDRSSDEEATKNDIVDTQEMKKVFLNRYAEVYNQANTEWAEKVKEYNALDKSQLDATRKAEYRAYFVACKKAVHETLKLVDFLYSLFFERWQKLIQFEDYSNNNFHQIPDVESLSDEQITDLLLERAAKSEKPFNDILNKMVDTINHSSSIKELCTNLNIEAQYYPINMNRKFLKEELTNRNKVQLKVGPIKTKDRGLQKVIETKDKTTALQDTLRATILCRDPVIPLLVIEHLKVIGKLTRVKNKAAPKEPYKCIHINFGLGDDGCRSIYELQIVFEEYYDLQKKDHDYYEIIRVM